MSDKERQEGKRSGDAIRTFICIEIPASVKDRIAELQQTLKRANAQVSWTRPSNIHLTLKFLGDVEPSRIEDVRAAVEHAASFITPFELEVSGAGCFPSARSPRVLWIGLSNLPDKLKQLHAGIENELAKAGFPREAKRFSPHLTIGRVRNPQHSKHVAEELIAAGFAPETFRANEVIVMRSDLKPTGSVYTPQAIIPLA